MADPPILILSPQQLQFPALPAISSVPTKQQFILQNGSHADMEWTSQIATKDGGSWLTLTPSSGTVGPPPPPLEDGPTQMRTYVSVSPVGLKPGVYTGSITITASRLYQGAVYEATNSPQTVSVTYTVSEADQPSVRVSANAVTLSGVAAVGPASAAFVGVSNAGPGTLNWSAAVQGTPGAPWLTVAPASGVNTGTLAISANPGSLAAGVYKGTVAVSAPGSPTQAIAVTYTVREPKPATLDVITSPLNFTAMAGSNPAAQTLAISNSGELVLNWKASSSTFNGGQWLTATPASGSNNGMLVVAPNASGLAPGAYAGRISVTSDTLHAQLQVNLIISRNVPSLEGAGFYNAASLGPDGVAAGSIASIFGNRLGPDSGTFSTLAGSTEQLPLSIFGTRVTIDGVPAPLFYVSAKQINLQIPYEAAGKNSVIAHIEAVGYDPADFKINLTPANIGIFTLDGKRAAALNQDGQLNSSQTPAEVGSVIQFYATGQGALDIPVPTGSVAPLQAPFPAPVVPIAVQVGGIPAKILFSGLAPGTVGMLQLNVQVPAGVAPSDLTSVEVQTGSGKPNVVYISTSAAQQ